ncbi:MAG: ribbon-helix-helix protein, CopG family [Solirubrobacteraceae bacterium MAG38_C4-C5]|nr:ribbon-helix-helix protein, CopG family [Candidatus Siliceabacter maunaloa]
MKTAISLPDTTFARADEAARKLGVSRSEFFARAAERWLAELEDKDLTEQINRSLEGIDEKELEEQTAFARAAAYDLAQSDEWQW